MVSGDIGSNTQSAASGRMQDECVEMAERKRGQKTSGEQDSLSVITQ